MDRFHIKIPGMVLIASLFLVLSGCIPVNGDKEPYLDITDQFVVGYAEWGTGDPLKLLPGEEDLEFVPVRSPENLTVYLKEMWLKTVLEFQDKSHDATILELPAYMIGKVDAWFELPNGEVIHESGGSYYPYSERTIKHAGVALPVPRSGEAPVKVLIRIASSPALNFTALLWSNEQWQRYSHNKRAWYALFFGAIIALAIYNIFLAFTLRDKSYLYYVSYMICFSFSVMFYTGLSEEYFWPDGKERSYVLMVSALGSFFGVSFVNSFLDIKSRHLTLYRLSTAITGLGVLQGAALTLKISFVPGFISAELMHAVLLLGPLYYIGISFISYAQGIKHARFLALGMSTLLVTLVLYYLYTYGAIKYNYFIYHVLELGLLADALLLSLALSDRIKTLADEKHELDGKYASIQRQFAREIIRVEESEKKKYSSILHDSVGHGLLVLKQHLDNFMKNRSDSEEINEVSFMKKQCSDVMDEVRTLSHDLHPHLLKNVGLRAALLSTLKRAFSATDIVWFTDIEDELHGLSEDIEIAIYRIAQETINNILKYARANEVYYALNTDERGVNVEIKDDGIGFDQHIPSSGLGLRTMKGHVELLSGAFNLDANPGEGTIISFSIPYSIN